MIDALRSLLGTNVGVSRRPPHDLRVATAALLLEVAEADQTVAPEEFETILSLLSQHFDLTRIDAEALLAQTREARTAEPDLWPFTNAIGEAYSPDEKRAILVMVWQVIFADGRLDPYEDQLAHRLELMLRVNHSLLMEAKQIARDSSPEASSLASHPSSED